MDAGGGGGPCIAIGTEALAALPSKGAPHCNGVTMGRSSMLPATIPISSISEYSLVADPFRHFNRGINRRGCLLP